MAKQKLPDVDSFSGMLRHAFPSGPLSDIKPPATAPLSIAEIKRPVVDVAAPEITSPLVVINQVDVVSPSVAIQSVSLTDDITEPAKQPANNQTNQPDSAPAKEPANNQTNQPDSAPAKEPANRPDNEPDIKPVNPVREPAQQQAYPDKPANEPVSQSASYPDNEPVSKPVHGPVIYPDKLQAKEQTKRPANYLLNIDADLWYPYTEKQGRILLYLIESGGRTKREHIATDTGINIATVKYALRVFVQDGYISPTTLDVNHKARGFSYSLNPHICLEYAARIFGPDYELPNQPANHQAYYPANRPVNRPVVKPVRYPANEPDSSFSSRKDFETSSSKTVDGIVLDDPELQWWKAQGLTITKTAEWLRQFEAEGLKSPDLIRSLKNAWYDAEINQIKPGGREIGNAMNWFFKFLPGGYPTPAKYRSYQQIQLDQEREELAELERQTEELSALRRKKRVAGLEVRFQLLLNDEISEEYQELKAQIDNSFVLDSGGDLLDQALREKYFEKNGIATG